MTGKKFGRWTVLDSFILTENNERKWLCRCECGTQRYVLERSLKSGGSLSCGCGRNDGKCYDLTGQVFGKLKVLNKSEQQKKNGGVWWHCVCECGNEVDYPATLLVTGKRISCGCDKQKNYYTKDISGINFGSITALYPTDKRDKKGNVIWHCRCNDCGNTIDISYNELLYTNRKSCGCQKKKHTENLHKHLTHVDGTSIDMIRSQKLPANNTTGCKGVYYIRGRYTAKIVFQKKAYYLGSYDRYEEAVAVRQAAEELLLKGTLEHYSKWQAMADSNPQWAKENPIKINTYRNENNEIEVEFLPVI